MNYSEIVSDDAGGIVVVLEGRSKTGVESNILLINNYKFCFG